MSGGFFPIVSTARSGECQHSFFPGLKKMHPSATRRAREPTGCVLVQGRFKQVCPDGLAVTGFWARNAPYFYKARVRAVGPSCSQRATSREFRDTVEKTCRTTQKSKGKGKRSKQRRIAKRITLQRRLAKDLQITKLGDDQERRPPPLFPKWRKTEVGVNDCPARIRP